MYLFEKLKYSIEKHHNRNAFCINGVFYTYSFFGETISKIRSSIQQQSIETEKCIGVVANDDIETYAAIIALWFEGKAFVPINPEMPVERNLSIINQASIKTIIDSSANSQFNDLWIIESKKTPQLTCDEDIKIIDDQDIVNLLFTSGTTGTPKGVPISFENLSGFVSAFDKMGINLTENDKCLQMFDLTFDLSVQSYLIPLLNGACVYTIPKEMIKYSYIYELMEVQKLTFSLMVPSILNYLRPYFREINLPEMRYSLFCGEALSLTITEDWSVCLPNAEIINTYGPTENTIYCTSYTFQRFEKNKSHNGILSIGKAMYGVETIVVDEKNQMVPVNTIGELCLGGTLLTPGYWNDQEKNRDSFFYMECNETPTRFYKTGDLCYKDEEGDLMYIGRLDSQIKVQGFRVELSEIEFHAKAFLNKTNSVILPIVDLNGNTEIGLVIESEQIDTLPLLDYLRTKIPAYMIPKQIRFLPEFEPNVNGKTDRKKIVRLFNKQD